MHWAVVGGAASVGKGRPGPISTQTEDDRGPIWTQAVRNVRVQNVAREEERDAHKNQHHNIAVK